MSLAKDKQEEIREGIAKILRKSMTVKVVDTMHGRDKEYFFPRGVDEIFNYLHSQGVVIKVKCPDCEWSQFVNEESVGMTPCHSCNGTGYLIEPLIEK